MTRLLTLRLLAVALILSLSAFGKEPAEEALELIQLAPGKRYPQHEIEAAVQTFRTMGRFPRHVQILDQADVDIESLSQARRAWDHIENLLPFLWQSTLLPQSPGLTGYGEFLETHYVVGQPRQLFDDFTAFVRQHSPNPSIFQAMLVFWQRHFRETEPASSERNALLLAIAETADRLFPRENYPMHDAYYELANQNLTDCIMAKAERGLIEEALALRFAVRHTWSQSVVGLTVRDSSQSSEKKLASARKLLAAEAARLPSFPLDQVLLTYETDKGFETRHLQVLATELIEHWRLRYEHAENDFVKRGARNVFLTLRVFNAELSYREEALSAAATTICRDEFI